MSTTGLSFDGYQSPYSWRYGSDEMRTWWGQSNKRRMWRKIWVSLAQAQHEIGLVSAEQLADVKAHAEQIDVARAHEIEAEIRHDLMAELKTFAEQSQIGGGILHLGATSMDVEDNADALRIRGALDIVIASLEALLGEFVARIEDLADTPTMAFTHLQPAEPTTMGYRLAQYAQDLSVDLDDLRRLRREVCGKGFKGAAGTSASYHQLLEGTDIDTLGFEELAMKALDLPAMAVATQTYARKQDYRVLTGLASLGQSLYKFAADIRLLQSPPLGEFAEPFGAKQVGSSAMPFKRNPIDCENIDSVTRLLATLPRVAWDNAAHSYLERTLDDSANRRTILPEGFLIADHALDRARKVITGLRIDLSAAQRLMDVYGRFAATERLMMELAKAGADRQATHEVIRTHSLAAWHAIRVGQENPLVGLLSGDPELQKYARAEKIAGWLDATGYVGDAPRRARMLANTIRAQLADND
jgi:adenylosuccinate lyase